MTRPRPAVRYPKVSRARKVIEAKKGNVNALRHGVFSEVANAPDVATEAALTFASHPDLDPIRDTRLVELYAQQSVSLARAFLAIGAEGHTAVLTSYASRLAPLVERLERTLHDREVERRGARRAAGGGVDLDTYAAGKP